MIVFRVCVSVSKFESPHNYHNESSTLLEAVMFAGSVPQCSAQKRCECLRNRNGCEF